MPDCDYLQFNTSANLSKAGVSDLIWRLENREAMYKLSAILVIGVVLLVGFFGNTLVCIVYHLKFPASTSKYFIMSLATFDLLTCTIALPGEIVDLRFDYHFNFPTVCKIMRFTITLSTCASVNLLIAIAVDRYRKICRPLESQMSPRETKIWIAVAVVIGVVMAIPAVILYGRKSGVIAGVSTSDCSFDEKYRQSPYPLIYLGITGVLCLLSFCVLIVLYVLIVLKVRNRKKPGQIDKNASSVSSSKSVSVVQKNNLVADKNGVNESTLETNNSSFDLRTLVPENKGQGESRRSKIQEQQSIKTTIMLFLVTVVFIISFIPHFILQIVPKTSPSYIPNIHCSPSALAAYKLFLRSYFINTAANPLIYGFYNPKFRSDCKQLLCGVFCNTKK